MSTKFDDFTFGKDPAGISLARILDEESNFHYNRKVARLTDKMHKLINVLKDVEDVKLKESIYSMLLRELKWKLSNTKIRNRKIETHLITHMTTVLRETFLR